MTPKTKQLYDYLQKNYSSKELSFGCEVDFRDLDRAMIKGTFLGIQNQFNEDWYRIYYESKNTAVTRGVIIQSKGNVEILGHPPTLSELLMALQDKYGCDLEKSLQQAWSPGVITFYAREGSAPILVPFDKPKVSDWPDDVSEKLLELLDKE